MRFLYLLAFSLSACASPTTFSPDASLKLEVVPPSYEVANNNDKLVTLFGECVPAPEMASLSPMPPEIAKYAEQPEEQK